MASPTETVSMALFCDFENVALGVRDANYDKFDIKRVLERLLLKGNIVVKKAYCDWDRYKGFKAAMHEANFELIEIPHVRQSGKNSADIRLVVDALDLCYTKAHVNTFVIISGDSDFSPLVSKLRENAKQVIGVGVKQSTSDLLIANCDEFIFYDDLVRESERAARKREASQAQSGNRRPQNEDKGRKDDIETRRTQAIEIAVETFEALLAERGDSGKIWASMLKEAIKRRKPDFSESYYGFRAFGNLLEEAQARGLLEFGRDEKSGAYVYRSSTAAETDVHAERPAREAESSRRDRSRRGGRRDGSAPASASNAPVDEAAEPVAESAPETAADNQAEQHANEAAPPRRERPSRRGSRRTNTTGSGAAPSAETPANAPAPAPASAPASAPAAQATVVEAPTAKPPAAVASAVAAAPSRAPDAVSSAVAEVPRAPSNASPAALRTSEKMKAADAAIAAAAAARAAQSGAPMRAVEPAAPVRAVEPAAPVKMAEPAAPAKAAETVAPEKAADAAAPAPEAKPARTRKPAKARAKPAEDEAEKPAKPARKPAARKKSAPKKDDATDDTSV
ncbi:NYN domain protein [Parazoarcus communis]|uniref:NYN domain protein n=1 Tax=Parazoarcus communis TaxID=41977 RepID=A0A2U8GMF9_9RHOO|nr:NYN domain-containing protein [Parazoarcus communis]AWI74857.1 NYN domain protein [Parazoarcus communis]